MPFFFAPPPAPDVSQVLQLVTPSRITIAELHAKFPPGPDYLGKFCQVSDLWGAGIRGNMRCGYNERIYYWEATTQNQMPGNYTVTGSVTVQPMSTPPIMELLGTLPALTTWTITLGTDNLPPGIIKEFRPSLSSLLGTLNVAGLGIGSVVSLALGGNRRFVSMDNGSAVIWRQLN